MSDIVEDLQLGLYVEPEKAIAVIQALRQRVKELEIDSSVGVTVINKLKAELAALKEGQNESAPTIPEGWQVISKPDAIGMGRLVVNGKYYGLPMEVINWFSAAPKPEDVK